MIAERFDSRTLTKMDLALEQACKTQPNGTEQHKYRRHIASRIVACAEAGDLTLAGLTEAGRLAATELGALYDGDPTPAKPEPKQPRARRSA